MHSSRQIMQVLVYVHFENRSALLYAAKPDPQRPDRRTGWLARLQCGVDLVPDPSHVFASPVTGLNMNSDEAVQIRSFIFR